MSELSAAEGLPCKKKKKKKKPQSFKSITAVVANYAAPVTETFTFGFVCQTFFIAKGEILFSLSALDS